MKILVVDDNPRHLASARELAGEHEVLTCDSYQHAVALLTSGTDIDVLLSDLLMPAEEYALGAKGLAYLGHEIPIGFVLMLRAAQAGVKFAAVVTDTNHHDHPMSAAIDWINPGSGNERCMIAHTVTIVTHAPLKDGVKDWATVLKRLLK